MNEYNVLGGVLEICSCAPLTGFLRDGYCHTHDQDYGRHFVCAVVDEAFLDFTRSRGNDLSTPNPAYQFPGLKPGDRWCLCVLRWLEAEKAGVAPRLVLESCHEAALRFAPLEVLGSYAQ
ncbi:MAG: DUF2237 family protein [Bernardetiaceae bacterium]